MNDFILPHPGLSPFIHAYLHKTVNFMDNENAGFHFCTPTPRKFIMIYLDSPIEVTFQDGKIQEKKDMLVIGPMSRSVIIDFKKEHRFIAVEMKNTGQYYMLGGCPIHTIMNCNIEAEAIFGNKVKELIEKLSSTSCPQKIKMELDLFFLNQLKNVKRTEPVDLLLNNIPNGKTILELASMAGISIRQLERKYREKIGISPSFYIKLNRFANAYKLKEGNPEMKWTEIAHYCGYFDQMHLIRDFREFSGSSPGLVNEILKKHFKGYIE